LVVFEPALGLSTDVFPCEDSHAQERSLCKAVLETVQAGDVWIQDRHFWIRGFLCSLDTRGAFFIARQPQSLPYEIVTPWREAGRVVTGHVAEHRVRVYDAEGQAESVSDLLIPHQIALPKASRWMQRPRPRSCLVVVVATQSV
jgi:hypothetical protein